MLVASLFLSKMLKLSTSFQKSMNWLLLKKYWAILTLLSILNMQLSSVAKWNKIRIFTYSACDDLFLLCKVTQSAGLYQHFDSFTNYIVCFGYKYSDECKNDKMLEKLMCNFWLSVSQWTRSNCLITINNPKKCIGSLQRSPRI